ncbi:PHD finger protein 7-like, partial [Apteryx rowi]|uniref:PHD finger protein 7-like n=1 Tax=Apteryx rowi TaxID=308060 RepID=UPI000E1C5C3A
MRERGAPGKTQIEEGSVQEVDAGTACMLCCRADVNVDICGPKHEKRGLCVHENCLFSASWLFQRRSREQGICGFMPVDIKWKIKSAAQKHRFACSERGAAISCQGKGCSRTFHLPCTSKQGCITQFFAPCSCQSQAMEGSFVPPLPSSVAACKASVLPCLAPLFPAPPGSFCWEHRPDQTVLARPEAETTCIICLEPVDDQISYSTMVCPACKGAWFHWGCIQGQAGQAGFSCFQCPLCKKCRKFLPEMFKMGIPIPFRLWELLLCSSCASKGAHRRCSGLGNATASWECNECAGLGPASSAQSELAGPSTSSEAELAASSSSAASETRSRSRQTGPERRRGRSR